MPQQEPEKKSAPAAQPIDMPDDEVLYELADLFRVFGDSTFIFWVIKLTVAFATPETVLAASSILAAQFAQSTSIL